MSTEYLVRAAIGINGESAEDALDATMALHAVFPAMAFRLDDIDYDEEEDLWVIPVYPDIYAQVRDGQEWADTAVWNQPDGSETLIGIYAREVGN